MFSHSSLLLLSSQSVTFCLTVCTLSSKTSDCVPPHPDPIHPCTDPYIPQNTCKVAFQHPVISEFISNQSQCANYGFLFILTHKIKWSSKACLLVRIACQQQEGGIRHRLTTSHHGKTSKREMASIRDIQKMCVC